METLEQLRRRVRSAEDLHSIAKTMKSMAAVGIRKYEQAAESLSDYDRTVRLGLRALLRDVHIGQPIGEMTSAERRNRPALLVAFGSDQGMCGQLNDRVAAHAESLAEDAVGPTTAIASGARLASALSRIGMEPLKDLATPSAIEDVTESASGILAAVENVRADHDEIDILFVLPQRTSAAAYDVFAKRVLPLDGRFVDDLRSEPWPTRCIPAWPGDRRAALRALMREYVFVSLYRTLVETLASENAARLSSMQSAEKNIEERLDELRQRYRRQRQLGITSELMDVVAGFEALAEEG